MTELTQQQLRELLRYDPETGVLTWRVSRGGVKAGAVTGSPHKKGYLMIKVYGRLYLAHRLAWLYVHGRWPQDQIDHINGVRDDNRLVNLREATNAQNTQNKRRKKDGLPGAYRDKRDGRWFSSIMTDGKYYHLGRFDTAEEAHEVYMRAKAELHPYSTLGRVEK